MCALEAAAACAPRSACSHCDHIEKHVLSPPSPCLPSLAWFPTLWALALWGQQGGESHKQEFCAL